MDTRALSSRFIPVMQQSVSFLGLGTIELSREWGIGNKERIPPSEADAIKLLNHALNLGISVIDTASAYHLSEERIGKAISHRRSEFLLASKCGEHSRGAETYYGFSYDAIIKSIDNSLTKLRTECIDIII